MPPLDNLKNEEILEIMVELGADIEELSPRVDYLVRDNISKIFKHEVEQWASRAKFLNELHETAIKKEDIKTALDIMHRRLELLLEIENEVFRLTERDRDNG